jgi:hypothetical protein
VAAARAARYAHNNSASELVYDLYSSNVTQSLLENSIRLPAAAPNTPDYENLCSNILETIKTHMHVTPADKAACVPAFAEANEVRRLIVCGACGSRDPEAACLKTNPLPTLPDDHWLRVNAEALAGLKRRDDEKPIELLLAERDGTGARTRVRVRRADLLNLVDIDGHAFHVVPSAGHPDHSTYLCPCCHRAATAASNAKGAAPVSELPGFDSANGLYDARAPKDSVARGDDYGRLDTLHALGIWMRPSTLEKLLLTDARTHLVIVKVIAYAADTGRKRCMGIRSSSRSSRVAWITRCPLAGDRQGCAQLRAGAVRWARGPSHKA